MIRTQIYLTQEQAETIKHRSQRQQRTEAEIINDLIAKGLRMPMKKKKTTGETLMDLVALGKKYKVTGPKNLSTNLDIQLP